MTTAREASRVTTEYSKALTIIISSSYPTRTLVAVFY